MFRFIVGFILCLALRFIPAPFRPPNVEPVTATLLPFGKNMGPAVGFLFGFLSMFVFDAATSGIGMWTFVTAITFGLMGVASHFFLHNTRGAVWQYALFAAIATIVYDLITGVLMGNLLFAMPLREAFVGQIPFTVNHLLGNIVLSSTLSPLLDRWVIKNPNLDVPVVHKKI